MNSLNPITLRPFEEEPEELAPGQLPPLPPSAPPRPDLHQASGARTVREMLDQIELEMTPNVERGLLSEAGSSLLRGAIPGALETTGQAFRGVGLERAGTAVKGAAETVREAAPRLFRPSTAAQEPGSFRNIVASAFESVGQTVAISAPAMAAAVASGGGALPVMAAYILSTPGVFGAAEYQNFFDEGRKAGIPDDVLRAPAVTSALAEAGFELAGNTIETLLIRNGLTQVAARGMKARLRQGIKGVLTPKIQETAATIAASGAAEGGTEALTEVAQTRLRQGVGMQAEGDPATAFAAGGLAGLLFGSAGRGIMRGVRRGELQTIASAQADPQARLQGIDQVIQRMQASDIDPEVIEQFSNYAAQAVEQGDPIPLGEDISGLGVQPQASPPQPRPMLPASTSARLALPPHTEPIPQPASSTQAAPFAQPASPVADFLEAETQPFLPRRPQLPASTMSRQAVQPALTPIPTSPIVEPLVRPAPDRGEAFGLGERTSEGQVQSRSVPADMPGETGGPGPPSPSLLIQPLTPDVITSPTIQPRPAVPNPREVEAEVPSPEPYGLPPVAIQESRASPEVAPPAVAPLEAMTFQTAMGSTYRVTPQGTTVRDKAARPEHPGDFGPQPESEQTIYVDQPSLNILGEFQTRGADPRQLALVDEGHIGIQYAEGPNAGKFERRTVVPYQTSPREGLYPIELWKGGRRVHFGNEIVQVQPGAEPDQGSVAPISPAGPSPAGRGGEYFTPSGRSYPFRYELIEADEAIPSHDPQTFSPNQLYEDVSGLPRGTLQFRDYHRENAEQAKVVEQDRRFKERFWFMLSDSPDATNGPPIVPNDSNVVLGGNSRMMTVLRKASEQNPEAYNAYRDAIKTRAEQFGVDPAQVDAMRAPVLIRRLNEVSTSDPHAMRTTARETDQPFTQALSEKAQAVASGSALSDDTIRYISDQLDNLGEESTLRDLFRTAASRELVKHLQEDGVITQRTINRYVRNGDLNDDGKTLIERAILGRIVPDSDLIDAAPAALMNTLGKTLRSMTQIQTAGGMWDIVRHVREAVRLVTDTKLSGWNTIDEHLRQIGMFEKAPTNPAVIAMAKHFMTAKPTETKKAFGRFAEMAGRDTPERRNFLFAPPQPAQPPWDAFNSAFGANLSAESYRQAVDPEGTAPPESMQFQAKRGQTSSQGGGQPWNLNLADVQDAFPGQSVISIPGGGFRVQTPAGYVDLEAIDRIQLGPQERLAFELGYGQPYSDDVSVSGRLVNQQGQARIELVKGEADRVTLLHEVEHWLENSGLLTPEEIQQLSEATGKENASAEDRAQWVAERLNTRRYSRTSAVGRLLDRVWDFLDRLLGLAGIQTTRGILRAIETGEVINRDNGAVINADQSQPLQQFQANYRRPADVEKENKLYSEYVGWSNMVGPEVAKIFENAKVSFLKQRISMGLMSNLTQKVLEDWTEHPTHMRTVLDAFKLHQRPPSSEEIGALMEIGKGMSDAILEARRQGTLTDNEFFEKHQQLVGPNSLFATFAGISSELGRSMRLLQEKPAAQRFFELMARKREKLGTFLTPEQIKDYETAFSKVLLEGDPEKLSRFFDGMKAENPTLWDYMKEFWYGSILSGPSTNIANLGGNTLWTFFNMGIIRPLEALLDPFIAKIQNRPAQVFMSEVFPSLAGFARGMTKRERWSAIRPGLKTGEFKMPGVTGIGKFERDLGMFTSYWQKATWQLDFPTMRKMGLDVGYARRTLKSTFGIEPGAPINFMRTVAPLVSLATRAMVGMDLLGKAAARDGLLNGMIERQVRQELQSGSLNENQASARRMELRTKVDDPADAQGRDMNARAMEEAERLTFTDEPSAVAKWILESRELPLLGKPLQLIIPFVATPDRLFARAIELVPGLGFLPYRHMLTPEGMRAAGTDLTSVVARQVAGIITAVMIYQLFVSGLVTGDVPDDPGEREAFFRQGKQPWSIKVGDQYVSYRRFEPLNMMIGWIPAMAEPYRRYRDKENPTDGLAILSYMGAVAANHVLESSYLSGLQGFFQAINKGGGATQPENFVSRIVDGWVPFAGLRRTIVRAVDAYETEEGAILRDPTGFLERITGASLVTTVQPRYNVWGQPVTIPGNVLSQFLPYRISSETRDVTENELARLKIFPGPPSKQDAKGKKLEQGDYDFLLRHGGQLAKGKLDRLVRQPFYQNLNPDLRELYLRRAIRQAREEARDELETRSRARGLLVGRSS